MMTEYNLYRVITMLSFLHFCKFVYEADAPLKDNPEELVHGKKYSTIQFALGWVDKNKDGLIEWSSVRIKNSYSKMILNL